MPKIYIALSILKNQSIYMQLTNFTQNYPQYINISKKTKKIPIKPNKFLILG
jgi:hypothetical protein